MLKCQEVKPAEFHKNWMEISSVAQTVNPGEQAYSVNNTIIVQGDSAAAGDSLPTETVALPYAKIVQSYGRD